MMIIGRRLGWSALIASIVLVTVLAGSHARQSSIAADVQEATSAPASREESWLGREIRRFSTFRHTDRAYRLIATGALEAAKAEFEESLAATPDDPDVRLNYIVLLDRLQAYPDVIREVDVLLRGRPDLVAAVLYRARAHQATDNAAAAVADFEAVAAAKEADPEQRVFALTSLVDLCLEDPGLGDPVELVDRLVSARPTAENYLRRGRVLQNVGRLDEAMTAFMTALTAARGTSVEAAVREARADLAERRQDWATAQSELVALLRVGGANAGVLRRLGQMAYAQHDFQNSSHWFGLAAALTGEASDREKLGNALYALADYRNGTREFTQLVTQVKASDDRHRIFMALGYGYMKLARWSDAVDAFRNAAQLKADVPTLSMMAEALERAGHPKEAAAALERAAIDDRTSATHLKLATLYTELKRWDQALVHLTAAAAMDPDETNGAIFKQQGFIYYELARYREARAAFERSLRHSDKDAAVYLALGETCMKLNAFEDAITYLNRALALTPRAGR